jgi:hypothetical protein
MRGGKLPRVTGRCPSRPSSRAASSGVSGASGGGRVSLSSRPASTSNASKASTSSRPSSSARRVRSSALKLSTVVLGRRTGRR